MTSPPTPAENHRPMPIANHWQRFRRLMVLMAIVAIAVAGLAVWKMHAEGVPFHLHFMIAMGGGIVIALLLAGVLMGLAFVSNRSGHDDDVNNPDGEI